KDAAIFLRRDESRHEIFCGFRLPRLDHSHQVVTQLPNHFDVAGLCEILSAPRTTRLRDHDVGPALEVFMAIRLDAEHFRDDDCGHWNRKVAYEIELPMRVEPSHAVRHHLTHARLIGCDPPWCKAPAYDL